MISIQKKTNYILIKDIQIKEFFLPAGLVIQFKRLRVMFL